MKEQGHYMANRPLPPGARLVPPEAKRVFQGEIFDVYHWDQPLFDGSCQTYEMLKRPDTVMVIAIDDTGRVVVNNETQPGGIVRKAHLPVGRVDAEDQSVLAAAQRELVEETGWEFAEWELIDIVQLEKKMEWFVYLFVAKRALRQTAQRLDSGEKIQTTTTPLADVVRQKNLLRYFPWLHGVEVVDDLVVQKSVREAYYET